MNNDDSSSLDGLARARRQRLRELDERRQIILRRAAAQAVSTDATLAAALASLPSSLPSSNRAGQLDSLLASSFPTTSSSRSSIADPLTGGYVPGSSLTRSYLSSPLGARLDELRIASLASELASSTSTTPSVRATTSSLLPSSRQSCLSGLSIALPNTTLAQFPLNERLQLSTHHTMPTVDNSHRLKRRRHEDLLKRARETMILKPGKNKANNKLVLEEEEGEKQHAAAARDEEDSSQDESCLPAASKKQKTGEQQKQQLHEFPLPPLATTGGTPAGTSRGGCLGVSLLSYRELWNKMGGHRRKELFQKRVQNARVPMMRRRRFLATRKMKRRRTPDETASSNSDET